MKPTEITSHKIACAVLGKDLGESVNIHDQLDDIADAINKVDGDYFADFNNPRQEKWKPYFMMDGAGFRFSHSYCDDSCSVAIVGSRLCHFVGSEAEADHLGKQFFELHKEHYLGQ